MARRQGFTMIELMVALALLAVVTAVMVSHVNYTGTLETRVVAELRAAYSDIEMAMNLYKNDKGDYPVDGFATASFVPQYLFPPRVPDNFRGSDEAWAIDSDATILPTITAGDVSGHSEGGYFIGHRTGAAAGSNGWFACAKVVAARPKDPHYSALVALTARLPVAKFYYGAECPSTASSAAPAGATTYYPTYWFTRE